MGIVKERTPAIIARLPKDATWDDVMNEVAREASRDRRGEPFERTSGKKVPARAVSMSRRGREAGSRGGDAE